MYGADGFVPINLLGRREIPERVLGAPAEGEAGMRALNEKLGLTGPSAVDLALGKLWGWSGGGSIKVLLGRDGRAVTMENGTNGPKLEPAIRKALGLPLKER